MFTDRAGGPALQREIIVRLDGLDCREMKNEQRRRVRKDRSARTGNVLITVQGSNDDGTVGELLAVLVVGGEETLKQSGSGIKHGGSLAARLHSDVNLLEVNELGGDLRDLGVAAAGEVGIAEERSQLVGLMLNEHVSERQRNKDVVRASVPHRTGCSQSARTCRSWGPGNIQCGRRSWRGQQHP